MNHYQNIPRELLFSILEYLDYFSLVKFSRAFPFNWEIFFQFTAPRLYGSILYIFHHINKELEIEGIWSIFYKNLLQMRIEFGTDNLEILLEKELADIICRYDKIFLEIAYTHEIILNFKHLYKYYSKLVKEGIDSILAIEWIYTYPYDDMVLTFPLVNKTPSDIFKDFGGHVNSNRDVLMFFLLYHDEPEMKMNRKKYDRILIEMIAYDLPDLPAIGVLGRKNHKQVYERLRALYGI